MPFRAYAPRKQPRAPEAQTTIATMVGSPRRLEIQRLREPKTRNAPRPAVLPTSGLEPSSSGIAPDNSQNWHEPCLKGQRVPNDAASIPRRARPPHLVMHTLSWFGIVRVGFVQMAIGSIVMLTTSTLNRVMVVELALPAVLPGALVAFYHAIQITRPNWGFRSDAGGRRTPWIIAGLGALAAGGFTATLGTILFSISTTLGLIVSVAGYAFIGIGAGAAATTLLTFMAAVTAPNRRAAASTVIWLMMILGIAMTAGIVGHVLDPYSHERLLAVVSVVVASALAVAIAAVWGIERQLAEVRAKPKRRVPFLTALREVWSEPTARGFCAFVFLSMTAYFMQDLILEPFAGHVFGLTPGQSTSMSGLQHAGVFVGMVTIGIAATGLRLGTLKAWTILGCVGSAAALAGIGTSALMNQRIVLLPLVAALGFFNGVFAVGAIGTMMQLAGEGREGREGTRMGLWGAAEAIAAGFGGFLGAAAVDVMRRVLVRAADAYAVVFIAEAVLFAASALLAMRASSRPTVDGETHVAGSRLRSS